MLKYAKADILEVRHSASKVAGIDGTSFSKLALATPKVTEDGFLYVKVRAISSRVNKNNDGWPSSELAKSYKTFEGRPIFVDHNNDDPSRTRGVIVSSQIHVDDEKTSALDPYYASAPENHTPPTWIELLLEVDAKSFPKLAGGIINKDIDAVSMGANIDISECSVCSNRAKNPSEYCDHINNKGIEFEIVSSDGETQRKLAYEDCYGINFFEISFVFDPADETALIREVGREAKVAGGIYDRENEGEGFEPVESPGDEIAGEQEANPRVNEQENVVAFRLRNLEKAGFPPDLAGQLAARNDINWHALVDIVEKGATPEQAYDIYSKAEDDDEDKYLPVLPGDFESPEDAHLVDYEGPGPDGSGRPLNDTDGKDETRPIQELIPGVQIVGYSETPFFGDMSDLMGVSDPENIDPYKDANLRKALFEKQPEESLPIDKLIFTQPNINWAAVQRVASDPNADPGNPYVVAHDTGHYVMDGHHRTVADWLRGIKDVNAKVLDLRSNAVPKDEVEEQDMKDNKKSKTARDYSGEERKEMAKNGEAMSDGSFPIKDAEDLKNAKHLIGQADDPDAARRHVNKRAEELGLDGLDKDDKKKSAIAGSTLATLAALDFDYNPDADWLKKADIGMGDYPLNDQSERTINYTPQSEMETAPEEVDTLRAEQRCLQCDSEMQEDKTVGRPICPECGWQQPPNGMDNPDLSLHERQEQQLDPNADGQAQLETQDQADVNAPSPGENAVSTPPNSTITQVPPVNAISRNESETVMGDMKFTVTHRYVESASSDNKVVLNDKDKKTDSPKDAKIVSDALAPVEAQRQIIESVTQLLKDHGIELTDLNKEAQMEKETDREVIKRVEEDGQGTKRTEEIVKEYGPMAENGEEEVPEGEAGEESADDTEGETSDDTSDFGGESAETETAPSDDTEDEPKWSSEHRLFAALKLAKLASEIGLISSADELTFVGEIEDETMEQITARMDTLSRVKEAGLAKKRLVTARRSSFPSLPKVAANQTDDDTPFEAVFL